MDFEQKDEDTKGFEEEELEFGDYPDIDYAEEDLDLRESVRGYEHRGTAMEDWVPLTTTISSSDESTLDRRQQRLRMITMPDEERFKIELEDVIREISAVGSSDSIQLTEQDKYQLINHVNHLPFIKYKNVWAYTLGYYMRDTIPTLTTIGCTLPTTVKHKLKKVSTRIKDRPITMIDVIKYARFWNNTTTT